MTDHLIPTGPEGGMPPLRGYQSGQPDGRLIVTPSPHGPYVWVESWDPEPSTVETVRHLRADKALRLADQLVEVVGNLPGIADLVGEDGRPSVANVVTVIHSEISYLLRRLAALEQEHPEP